MGCRAVTVHCYSFSVRFEAWKYESGIDCFARFINWPPMLLGRHVSVWSFACSLTVSLSGTPKTMKSDGMVPHKWPK